MRLGFEKRRSDLGKREREREGGVYCEFSTRSFEQKKWSLIISGEYGKKETKKTKQNRERGKKKRDSLSEVPCFTVSFCQGRTFGNGVVLTFITVKQILHTLSSIIRMNEIDNG